MNARKLIIDCDPGIDDSLALMLAAASKELDHHSQRKCTRFYGR